MDRDIPRGMSRVASRRVGAARCPARGAPMKGFRLKLLLSHKIAAIGVAGVLGIAVVGAIYLIESSVQERYRRAADNAQAEFALASKLYVDALESRRAEKDFLLRSDMKYAERHGEVAKSFQNDIVAWPRPTGSDKRDELRGKIDTIGMGFQAYLEHFGAVVEAKRRLGLDENSGLEGALRKSVHEIESKLGELKQPPLMVSMLMMRRHEKDFMLRRSAKYGDDMKKRASE